MWNNGSGPLQSAISVPISLPACVSAQRMLLKQEQTLKHPAPTLSLPPNLPLSLSLSLSAIFHPLQDACEGFSQATVAFTGCYERDRGVDISNKSDSMEQNISVTVI